MSHSKIDKIEIFNESGIEAVRKAKPLYQVYFGRSNIGEDEIYFFARSDNKFVGVVRLSLENSVYLLRSMLVIPDLRGLGIGLKLLRGFEQYLDKNGIKNTCCLPWAKLETLYGKVGFKRYQKSRAPIFLQKRLTEYQSQNEEEIIFMMRD